MTKTTRREVTERDRLLFAYISGFERGSVLKKEWTKKDVIKHAAWCADCMLSPGSMVVWDDGNTFPERNLSAPPAILDFSNPFLSRGRNEE